jgi:hypothetical protein
MSDFKIVYIDDEGNQREILASTYPMLKALYPSNGRVMYIGEATGTEFTLDWDGLRLIDFVYQDALKKSPFQVNWKDPSQMASVLHRIERETPGSNGSYEVALEYGKREDFNDGGTEWSALELDPPETPPYVIVSRKDYEGDINGPGSRGLTNRLYKTDGTFVENTKLPRRTYARAIQIAKGRTRRQAYWDNLIADYRGQLEAAAEQYAVATGTTASNTAAADVISLLDTAIERFVKSAESDQLVATMSAHPILVNFVPVVQAVLAPWDDVAGGES